jgi:hypothetical protein
MIHETLRALAVPIDEVHPHPSNVRQGDIGLIAQSLKQNGQFRPIIVQQSSRRIIAGNHTWKAAKSLGWAEIAVQFLQIDDDRALRIMLADNKANDAATYDDAELLELLRTLVASDAGLEGTLFDGDDLDSLIALLEDTDEHDADDDASPQLGETKFAIIIELGSESDQAEMLQQLLADGYNARPLML